MLRHLHIRDFAIAPELDLEFSGGFTTITGETGAGKSILVDALGLLLGGRSDASWVRDGAQRAQLSAEFDLARHAGVREWLIEEDLDDDHQCLLRRSIAATGRSRAWINGTPVTAQQLARLGERLVEIHGQNEHLALTREARQLQLLDTAGQTASALSALQACHEHWRELSDALSELAASSALSPAELDLLSYQHRELEEEAIPADELEALELEHRKLSRGGELLESIGSALEQLDGDEQGVADQLTRLQAQLSTYQELDEDIAASARLLEESAISAREASTSLRAALARVDVNPERLQSVRARLDRLGDLARKHQVPMEELSEVRDRLAARLERSENFTERRAELEDALDQALEKYRAQALKISAQRKKTAQGLADEVTGLMAELGMQGGKFEIDVQHEPSATPSPRGTDRVRLLVSANPGVAPGPLEKIASGGELSRISLAIKVASAGGERRVQVFDEVDAGIGGDTANAVGALLRRLSADGQALCVTHLAQVAARADQQVRVNKQVSTADVAVDTQNLDEEQRVEEIARMLSGKASEQSLQHARELLAGGAA